MADKKRLLTNEEVEYLAEAYLKLKTNKTYKNLSQTFKEYIEEFLEDELLAIKKFKEATNGKK